MFPDLPLEIEDLIFEYAALMHPRDASSLAVVSKRVQACVEKVIYEKLQFFPMHSHLDLPFLRSGDITNIRLFKYTVLRRPAEFFATHVRSIFFHDLVKYRWSMRVLKKCTGLEHLVFIMIAGFASSASSLVLASANTLQSLMTTQTILQDMADSGIVCPRLRYLWADASYDMRMQPLHWLPALHTVVLVLCRSPWDYDSWKDDVETIITSTQNLQVLSLWVGADEINYVDQWSKTIVSPIKIKARIIPRHNDPLFETWRRLTTSINDVLLEN